MAKSDEINYFKSLSEADQQHAVNKPFSAENCGDLLIKLGFIQRLLPSPPARILDFGCGTGWTSWILSRMGYEVVGQDISADMLEMARMNGDRYGANQIEFVQGDYESLNWENEFDATLFFDCLHHAVDEKSALLSAFKALKPDGICVAHEPGIGHAENQHTQAEVAKYQVTEKDTPPSKLRKLAAEIGFREFQIVPFPDEALTALLSDHPGHAMPKFGSGYFEKRKHRKLLERTMSNAYTLLQRLDDSGIVILKK